MQKKVYEVIESGYEPGKVIFKGEIYNPYTPDLDDPCKIILVQEIFIYFQKI